MFAHFDTHICYIIWLYGRSRLLLLDYCLWRKSLFTSFYRSLILSHFGLGVPRPDGNDWRWRILLCDNYVRCIPGLPRFCHKVPTGEAKLTASRLAYYQGGVEEDSGEIPKQGERHNKSWDIRRCRFISEVESGSSAPLIHL